MSDRSQRVIEWANLHGDNLAHALRLDEDDDAETLAIIEDALWCAHDLETEGARYERALRWMAAEWAKYAEDHPKGVDVPHPDLVRGGIDMALEHADREVSNQDREPS